MLAEEEKAIIVLKIDHHFHTHETTIIWKTYSIKFENIS